MWSHKHSGQDFAVPSGTKVKAAHGGTVVKAGPNGGGDGPAYGNAIVIKHANGTYSQYAHLSQIKVQVGQQVEDRPADRPVRQHRQLHRSRTCTSRSAPTPTTGRRIEPGRLPARLTGDTV